MRTINAKLLLGLLLASLFGTGAVFGVHHFQYRRIADSLLWQARRAEEKGQIKRQAKYLQRYLEFNPKDLDTKAQLARLWAGEAFAGSERQRLKAVRLLDDVLMRGEDKPELRRLLIQLALEVRHLKMARTHLEQLLAEKQLRHALAEPHAAEAKPDPARGEAEGCWGELFEIENKKNDAIGCCRLAVRHAPQVPSNYVRLAHLLRQQKALDAAGRQGNQKAADRVIDEMVAHNPLSQEARLARWRYRREHGLIDLKGSPATGQVKLNEAAQDVEQTLQKTPESVDALLAAADLERLRSQAALAGKGAAVAKEKQANEHRNKALSYLNKGLKLHGQAGEAAATDLTQFKLLWHKANLLLDDSQLSTNGSEISQAIEQIRKTRGNPTAADYLRARRLLHERRWAEAVTLLEQAQPALGGQADLADQINLYLGQCYEQLEESGQMFNAYKRLMQNEPNSVLAALGMARAEWAMSHLDNAVEIFRKLALSGQMPDKVWLDYVRLEIQRQAQQDRPDWQEVENLLENATKANPKSFETSLLTAQMWTLRDPKSSKARDLLRHAQSDWPRQVEVWTARIQLELRERNPEEARRLLTAAKKALGDAAALRLAEARSLAAEPKAKDQEASLDRLAENMDGFSEEDRALLLNGLADTQLELKNLAAARRLWQRVTQLPGHRRDLRLHMLLFDLAVQTADEDGMRQALQEIRAVEGDRGPFHRYGEALRLIGQARKQSEAERGKTLAEARRHLDQVAKMRSTWPPVFLARAQIERLTGNPDRAIRDLQEAVRYGENSPLVIRELVELLGKAERYAEADEALRQLREPLLVNSDLGRLAASVAVGLNNTRQALERFNKNRVKEDTSDYRDLLWEGRMLAEVNRPQQAEEKLRAAVKLAEKEPEPYVTLVQFLVRQKREKEADAVLEQARRRLPAERAALALGQCNEALGRKKSAQERYEEALQGHRRDAGIVRRVAGFYWNAGLLPEAEPLLRDLAEGSIPQASADDVNWARWHLALVLAGGEDFGRYRDALKLVGLKLDERGHLTPNSERTRGDSTDAKRFQARVLAAQAGHRQFRRRAIEVLEELERHKALRSDDRFILAMLYEAEGGWLKAKPILSNLADEREPSPRHLAHFAQALIANRELDEAGKWIDKLEAMEKRFVAEPNAFAAVELRARWLEEDKAHKGGEKALGLLEKHVRRPKAQPEEVLLVLNLLRRQGKLPEALERCKKTWQEGKCAAVVIGGASVALLRDMRAGGVAIAEETFSFIETQLRNALQSGDKKEDKTVLLLHLADLFDQRGRWEEAEAMYRQVLRADNEPRNVVALNNLAWLLAQRSDDAEKVQEALTRIESAIQGIGRRADLLDTRGLVHLKLGRQAAAVADFREAAADRPTPTHLYHLARAHFQARDKLNAFKTLKQARASGLDAGALHPIERETCQRLLEELKVH